MSVDAPALDLAAFRALFRQHPAGVAVITLDAGFGPAGFTATSFTSVSARPPLATFVIDRASSTWPHLRTATTVVVNLLRPGGEAVARRFATSGIDRFDAPTQWERLPTGEPVLADAAHWLRGPVVELIPVGDHHLAVIGIQEIGLGEDGPGLVYHRGTFHAVRGDG
jgi:flavin reductase (DIM6/NTAB) family NADH-FMN oxidoreductase RutF